MGLKSIIFIFLLVSITVNGEFNQEQNWANADSFYDFTVTDLDGNKVSMEKYRGHLVIAAGIATQGCPLSAKALKTFQALQDRYCGESDDNSLRVVVFVVDGMMKSSGTNEEIKEFFNGSRSKFDVYGKIDISGDDAHPICKWFGARAGLAKVPIAAKFLIGRDGKFLTKIDSTASPVEIENEVKRYI